MRAFRNIRLRLTVMPKAVFRTTTQAMTKRVHLLVSGRVQGVSFRAYTMREATSPGLKGWVRNLPDGTVEILAEGPFQKLEQLILWAHRGPSLARVDHVQANYQEPTGEFAGFSVRYLHEGGDD